jgi:5,10-methylenetetrahydromethanopterin reductase
MIASGSPTRRPSGRTSGRAWRKSIERIPEEPRHRALHVGHGIEINEHDRAHVPMTAATRLTFTGTPRELRARLADLEARGATETVFGVRGPDRPRELRAFAALIQDHSTTAAWNHGRG